MEGTTPQPGFGVQSWNGSATWSRRNDRPQFGEAELTAPLFDVVNMRLAFNVLDDTFTRDTSYPSVGPGVTYDPATGYATAIKLPATFNLTAMPVVGQYSHSDTRFIQVQNDYTTSLKPEQFAVVHDTETGLCAQQIRPVRAGLPHLVTPNPLFNLDTTQPVFLLSDVTSKGYELNVVGGITSGLSIIASATDQKYRDAFNRRTRNVPDHLADLLLNYHWHSGLLTGANVFAGVVYEGNVAGETVTGSTKLAVPEQPSFYVPAWTVVNAGAGYTYDRYTVHLNLDNLLNRHFFWDPASRISVPMYDGLTARATFTAKF